MRFALIAALVLHALPAIAQEAPLVSLQTADDSKGWNAVGRLNLGKHGFCSGALIAPDLVLTAAHCLYDKTTGARIPAQDIEFLAGLRNGRAEAYRKAARAVAHPEYIYSGNGELDRVGFDIALIQLDQPIRQPSITPFATADAQGIGAVIGVVSYAQDRA
jgi:protease YdgD